MNSIPFVSAFLTGLFTGGLTCMAVQGGLLASTIAQKTQEKLVDESKSEGHALPIISFLVTKIIVYTILGFLLGYLGSFFQLSLKVQVVLQFTVIVFMLGTALHLLNVHPIFRYFAIQPPKFLTRLLRRESKSSSLFAPAFLGALTVFIPCPTTQAMMALSIASGSAVSGALILFAFTLGTSPLFFILGYFTTRLGTMFQSKFATIAALSIMLLAVFNINNALALSGSPITLDSLVKNIYCGISFCGDSPVFAQSRVEGAAVSEATIDIKSDGYSPNNVTIKKGSTVTFHLVNNGGGGCTQAFTIPSLGIQKVVPVGSSGTVAFKAPENPGEIDFMCGMGMYRGKIRVI